MALDINVVVIGGCGFLGQHIVAELLNEKENPAKGTGNEPDVNKQMIFKDIKVLDVKSFNKDLLTGQRQDAETVTYEVCDVRDFSDLKEHLKGHSVVINCAVVSPDFLKEDLGSGEHMHLVNVEGTRNIIKACQETGVTALVHISSLCVNMGGKRLIEHTESLSPEVSEDDLVLGDYARGRLKAEGMVLEASETASANGTKLKTVALRPPVLYGEGDSSFVPLIHKLAKAAGCKMPSIGNPAAFTQAAYAGNVATACICAIKHLLTDEGRSNLHTCNGLPVYVTDDTPPNNLVDLASPFLGHTNIEPSAKDHYWTVTLSLYWNDLMNSIKAKIGLSGEGEEHALPTWALHQFAGTITVVSRMRAELCLGYAPPYSWEQALKRSNLYYSRCLN
ncbi:uncharacterized protein [Palaemon carinicauda]|uniref:uncharacterized protein isoform X2 n=1 Tax=Palaemon carinicauda TaxID=392227 RepID=UPI0035B60274